MGCIVALSPSSVTSGMALSEPHTLTKLPQHTIAETLRVMAKAQGSHAPSYVSRFHRLPWIQKDNVLKMEDQKIVLQT